MGTQLSANVTPKHGRVKRGLNSVEARLKKGIQQDLGESKEKHEYQDLFRAYEDARAVSQETIHAQAEKEMTFLDTVMERLRLMKALMYEASNYTTDTAYKNYYNNILNFNEKNATNDATFVPINTGPSPVRIAATEVVNSIANIHLVED